MKRYMILIGLLILAAAVTTSAQARSESPQTTYDLTWSSIDGGGGSSSGGGYTLDGTIGQADAGSLSGGVYILNGGFWNATVSVVLDQFVYLPLILK